MAARRNQQQFQFTSLEMLAVAVGYVITSSFVFMLGIAVGRDGAAEHSGAGAHVARVPLDDPSRYALPADDSPLVPSEEAAVTPPVASAPTVDGRVTAPQTPEAVIAAEQAKLADPKAAPQQKALSAPDAPEKPAVTEGGYSVQVLATRRKGDAEAMARSLKSGGFDAYVRAARDGDDFWYRVRVGRYATAADAREVAGRCRDELGLDQAFVSRY
jgi:cell division septation protein DedD